MKTSVLSSVIGLSLLISACQPRDVDYRTQSRVGANGSGSGGNSGPEKSIDMTPKETQLMMVVSLERMGEALHYAKSFLMPDYASANGLVKVQTEKAISTDEINETYLETIRVDKKSKTDGNSGQVNFKKTNNTSELSYKVDEFSMDPSGKLRKLVFIKNNFKPISTIGLIDQNGKKSDFKTVNISDRIMIRATSDDGVYIVKISRSDSTASKADKNTTIYLDVVFKLNWSGEIHHLDGELKISELLVKFERQGSKVGKFQIKALPENLTMSLGQCVSMNGSLDLGIQAGNDKMTNPEVLTFNDSSAVFSTSKVSSPAQPCEVRPVVDLTRLL